MSDFESKQQQHFDAIAEKYSAHYGDKYSRYYRDEFINKELLSGTTIDNKVVMDAMCGSGENAYIFEGKVKKLYGVDISSKEIAKFSKRYPEFTGVSCSILNTDFKEHYFDLVLIVGGLHHMHPKVNETIEEVYRVLKPGGVFLFVEPHSSSIINRFRNMWYKNDKLFEENEEAISIQKIKRQFEHKFHFDKECYKGNIAYLLVLNSMIFRVPKWLKKLYSPLLLFIEKIVSKFQTETTSCFVICKWVKK